MAAAFIWAVAAVVARILAVVMSVVAGLSMEAAPVSAERMLEVHAISVVRANSMEAAMSGLLVHLQGRVALAMPAAPSIAGLGMLRVRRLSAPVLLQRQTARHG